MNYRIAFTGHRPNKLYGYNLKSYQYDKLKDKVNDLLVKLIKEKNANCFINGGAVGFDTLVFDVVENLQKQYNNIYQIIAIPFYEQSIKWPASSIQKYNYIKSKCITVYVDRIDNYKVKNLEVDIYNPVKMQKRNEWMVDNCDLLIACWNGNKKGGTYNCINYAKSLNKKIIIIDPNTLNIIY